MQKAKELITLFIMVHSLQFYTQFLGKLCIDRDPIEVDTPIYVSEEV